MIQGVYDEYTRDQYYLDSCYRSSDNPYAYYGSRVISVALRPSPRERQILRSLVLQHELLIGITTPVKKEEPTAAKVNKSLESLDLTDLNSVKNELEKMITAREKDRKIYMDRVHDELLEKVRERDARLTTKENREKTMKTIESLIQNIQTLRGETYVPQDVWNIMKESEAALKDARDQLSKTD